MYESELVANAIFELTGGVSITGSNADQYITLMDNAVNVSEGMNLQVGQALSDEQIANLDEDIVWMVEKEVNGEKVLVPVVYMAKGDDLKAANIISGGGIDLDIEGEYVNTGKVSAAENILIDAESILNYNAITHAGGSLEMNSTNDIAFFSSQTKVGGNFILESQFGDIISKTLSDEYTLDFGNNNVAKGTIIGDTNTFDIGGSMLATAQNDITALGSEFNVKGLALLNSKLGDITIGSVQNSNEYDFHSKEGFEKGSSLQNIQSSFNVGNLLLNSGNDISVVASNLNADNAVVMNAGNDVNIISAEELSGSKHKSQSTGLSIGFSDDLLTVAKSNSDSRSQLHETQKASNVTSQNIVINSGGHTNIIGSKLTDGGSGSGFIGIEAKGDVNILAAKESAGEKESHSHKAMGIGFTANANELSVFEGAAVENEKTNLHQNGLAQSELSSGTIAISSGNNVNVMASNLSATGNMAVEAININVLSGSQSQQVDTLHESLKVGATLGIEQHVSSGVTNAANSAQNAAKGATNGGGDGAISAVSGTLQTIDTVNNTLSNPISAGINLMVEGSRDSTHSSTTSAVGSKLSAGGNLVLNAKDTLHVTGSDIGAGKTLSISASELIAEASKSTNKSQSQHESVHAEITVLGTNEGSWSVGGAMSKNDAKSATYTNSHLSGGNVVLNVSGDATLEGAQITGAHTDTHIGGDLNIISLQDTSKASGYSLNVGVGSGGGKESSTAVSLGGGANESHSKWVGEQSGIITTETASIHVEGNTDLQGGIIATIDENGNDANGLDFSTGSLSYSDIKDKNKGSSFNAQIGSVSKESFDTKAKGGSPTLQGSYASHDKEQITHATIGQGSVQIGDGSGEEINRDITKAQEITKNESTDVDVYVSESSVKDLANMDETASRWGVQTQQLDEHLPDAKSDNALEATAGEALDLLGTFGIIPTNGNNGGVIGELPILAGQGDVRNPNSMDGSLMALQVTTQGTAQMQANPDAFIPIQESEYYANAGKVTQAMIDTYTQKGTQLYVTSEPVAITSKNATYQNFTNGILNTEGDAIKNALTQTGSTTFTLNYNPSHGALADLLESAWDKFGGTTGMAKQTGDFIADTSADRGKAGSNYMSHSQGNALTYSGLQYAKEQGMLQKADYFIDSTKQTEAEQKEGLPSFGSFGSPISSTDIDTLITNIGYTYIGSMTHDNDMVGEMLGGNKGLNGQMDTAGRIESVTNLFDLFKDPTVVTHENGTTTFEGGSPHSTYNCSELGQLQYCGDRP